MENSSVKPNFLIIGAAKSGTTTLYEYLRQHPEVFMPDWKEPAFFAPAEAGGVQDEAAYLALFEGAQGRKAVGEASVAYLYAAEAPRRIAGFLGTDTKLIVILRRPADMAYSNWAHQFREGYENMPFEKALAHEEERLADPAFFSRTGAWAANLAYRGRARYRNQLEPFLALFPRENIKIYLYNEFFKPDLPLWGDLCAFLGISPGFSPAQNRHNTGWQPRFHGIQAFLNRPSAVKSAFKRILPPALRDRIRETATHLNRSATPLPPLDPELRKKLEAEFANDVRWLEQLLQRPPGSVWP